LLIIFVGFCGDSVDIDFLDFVFALILLLDDSNKRSFVTEHLVLDRECYFFRFFIFG